MIQMLFGRYSWPLVALGMLVAVACLASTWYIQRIQTDLARAVRQDAAGMEAAVDLMVRLRNLRVHTLVLVADRSATRWDVVWGDLAHVDDALGAIERSVTNADDIPLKEAIARDYAAYRERLGLERLPPPGGTMPDVARWSDEHHMADLLAPCRELADRQQERMNADLARTETQTAWAGRSLLGLGLAGVFGGLLSGYATARGLSRRVAALSLRIRAVQAELDRDLGKMPVSYPDRLGELDSQLDEVVRRVKEVSLRLHERERELLQAEHLAAVGQLAAGVAHEIRNPLTGVKILLQAAVRPNHATLLTPERLPLLLEEVARIERTVQGLVDFARLPPPDRQLCDLRDLVTEAVRVAGTRAEIKEVTLREELPPNPVPANVDRDQLLSLLTNLLFNAIEATPSEGEVGVRVAVLPDGSPIVEVSDTGPGIDPAIAPRLFTPFATTKPAGTGLGLTIARRIAQEHSGTLTVIDRPGGGACLILQLPGREIAHAEASGR